MRRFCLASRDAETGGILIGRYSDDRSMAFVEQVTGPPPDSRRAFATFFRGVKGLQELLDRLWAKPDKRYYLGEWHYHLSPILTPSRDDVMQMGRIASSNSYACPEPILVIVTGPSTPRCLLSVTIHPFNSTMVPLTAFDAELGGI
jgi:hypothetical protein